MTATETGPRSPAVSSGVEPAPGEVSRLKPNAVGLWGVVFMAVATAAPITAMVGNTPIIVSAGNGVYAPATFMVATIVLGLFAVGYGQMAKHITATGAFYTDISHGLGREIGLASGALTTMAYMVFEASLVGIFSVFAKNLVNELVGVDVPWIVFALLMLAANAALTYFDINLASKVLGVFLITEIVMLSLFAFSVLFTGGAHEGWSWASLNPLNGFRSLDANVTLAGGQSMHAVGTAGIGLFFAFWSWVGFESTAMYGEESKDPKRIIPLATVASVLGIGIFYVFVSWMGIVGSGPGTGPTDALATTLNPDTMSDLFLKPVEHNLGHWAVVLFSILLVTGSYACGMAFHNSAAHYLYAIGRENLIPGFGRTLGASHPKHGSPYISGFVQSTVALIIVLFYAVSGRDPYGSLYGVMALLGTTGIMIVQALTAFSVISYFHVQKNHPETAHWFRTLLAPALGGIGMVYVVILLFQNMSFAAGSASGDIIFRLIPWIVGVIFVAGLVFAIVVRRTDPEKYQRMGHVVLDEPAGVQTGPGGVPHDPAGAPESLLKSRV